MSDYKSNSRYYGIKEDIDLLQEDLINMNVSYEETIVMSGEKDSIELVSQRCYNNPSYWWVICRFNGILNPCNIPVGLKLRIPDIQKLRAKL